jgi:hypothetical protein
MVVLKALPALLANAPFARFEVLTAERPRVSQRK